MNWSNLKVYVHGPGSFPYMTMFLNRGLKGTNDINKADIVCFTGGADVNPMLYKENNLVLHNQGMSHFNPSRDDDDAVIHGYAVANESFQVGICRGGQFLNVMNGGRMWQHVDGHSGGPHTLVDTVTNQQFRVSSTHHQMMRPADDGVILAVAREARNKYAENDRWYLTEAESSPVEWFDDVEAVWYPGTRSLCFQPHPEFSGVPECTDYFFDLIERHYA